MRVEVGRVRCSSGIRLLGELLLRGQRSVVHIVAHCRVSRCLRLVHVGPLTVLYLHRRRSLNLRHGITAGVAAASVGCSDWFERSCRLDSLHEIAHENMVLAFRIVSKSAFGFCRLLRQVVVKLIRLVEVDSDLIRVLDNRSTITLRRTLQVTEFGPFVSSIFVEGAFQDRDAILTVLDRHRLLAHTLRHGNGIR